MRRDKPPAQRHSDCYSRKIYTASASGKSDCNPDKPETLGSSDSLSAPNPCAGGRRKTDGSQKPIHNFKDRTHGIYPAGENRCFKERPKRNRPPQPPLRRMKQPTGLFYGGGDRDRTDDLLLAKQMLSQLSYAPENGGPG